MPRELFPQGVSRMTDISKAIEQSSRAGQNMALIQSKLALTQLAEKMQEYIDEGDEHITLGENIREEADVEYVLPVRYAAQLFNDLLLYMNGGVEPPLKVKIPTAE